MRVVQQSFEVDHVAMNGNAAALSQSSLPLSSQGMIVPYTAQSAVN